MRQTVLIYLHVTARLQLINCLKRRTSQEISTHDFNFHPLCVRRNTTLIFLVNSQIQCSHVIQTQAQKCD